MGGLDDARRPRGGHRARPPRAAGRLRELPRRRACSRRWRPTSTRSPAAGSSSVSAPAGTRPSTAPSGLPYDHRVSRFEESFEIVRRMLAGERVTLDGRFWQVDDLVVLPRPAEPVPLMIGSNGERMLSITLPHVDRWNTWYAGYGNTAEGFAELNATDHGRGRARRPRPGRGEAQRRGARRARRRTRRSARTPTRRSRRSRRTALRVASPGARAGRRRRGDPDPPPDHRGVDPGAGGPLLAAEQLVVGTSRITCAGLPTTTVRGGTSFVTTAPAPTNASSPISIRGAEDRAAADPRAAADRRALDQVVARARCGP